MIKRFILSDESNSQWDDLIEFDEEVDIIKIKELIQQCKNELEGEYSNEDIYKYIGRLNIPFKIIWLGGYEKVYY